MKTISSGLAQHLAGEVTTLATCWKITRRDGVVLGFTDHVRDLEVDGVTYKAASGYTRTAIRSTADLAVDNLDIESVFSDDGITEEDLRTGRYDFAEVRMFPVKLRRGWLGEVVIRDGMYVAELRGMTQRLQMTVGEVYTPDCSADRAGLEPSDLDTSELDQEVRGYMVPRPVAVREALEKLQQAYLFDVVESDWTLAFRKREREPVLTIGDESLAAHEPGNQRPPKFLETRTQEAELPRRVTVRYIARENDYQAAAQQAQLIQDLYETQNELVLELPVVMTDDEAKRAAWAILASAWVERNSFELFLPPSFLALDPGDVVDIEKITEALAAMLRLRLTEIDLSGGWLLRLKGVTDDPIVWQTSHAIGAPTPASQQTGIPFETPTQGFYLNLPALSAEDGQTGAFWLGAALQGQAGTSTALAAADVLTVIAPSTLDAM